MKPINILRIRLVACMIWFMCGVYAGGITGYGSAVASAMFYIAGMIEWRSHAKN